MSKNRFSPKSKIRKGDKVTVIAGAYKGTTGEVREVIASKNRAIVEGVNEMRKHTKPTQHNPGGINDINTPIHMSNLQLVDPKSGEATRVGWKIVDGKSKRYSKKSGEII